MQVFIMSGISGSGKSTFIRNNLRDHFCQPNDTFKVVSADDYFIDAGGNYRFEPYKLGKAHAVCLRAFIESVQLGADNYADGPLQPILVVDNTNLTSEEIAPYYAVSKAYGYQVTLITLHIPAEKAFTRAVHGVLPGTLKLSEFRLKQRRLPPYWDLKLADYRWDENFNGYL